MTNGGRQLKTVQKAFDIVHELEGNNGLTLAKLSDSFNMSKGTLHTYLNTLKNEGYVRKVNGQYETTLKWFEFGSRIRDKEAIYQYGKGPADDMARQTGELIYLAVEQRGLVHYIYPAQGKNASEPATPVGRVRPLHAVSAGKVLLAEMPKEKRRRFLEESNLQPITKNTIVDKHILLEELDEVSSQGYALNDEEEFLGSRSIATVISNPQEGIAGSISASGPTSRFDDKRINELLPLLKEAANQIEINYQRDRLK